MSRRILVTGGAGFIGSHTVETLLAQGDDPHVLDDFSRGRQAWLPDDVPIHQVDIRDPDLVRRAVGSVAPDIVIHLAALHFIPAVEGAPRVAEEVNVEGTRNLLAALAHHRPQRVLFASTAAVYPDVSGPISETCDVAPMDLYGRTKAAGESLLARFHAETAVHVVVARLFNVIGRRETNPHVVPEIVAQLKRGVTRLRLGNVDSRRDYTDVVDVADVLVRLVDSSVTHSIFNVGSGSSRSVREVVALCERIVRRSLTVTVDPTRLRSTDRHELLADVALVKNTTGWAPQRAFEETLSELLLEK
jgi:UDP-glucose 4-epimerase